ncbi:MAG: arabinose-5-phosphate isomerase [Mariniblastus sp.]|jgi:arabinose-5-phosphate isomerase
MNNQSSNSGSTTPENRTPTESQVIDVLRKEAEAILAAAERVDLSVETAVQILLDCTGRVIVTGMGKMGCIARKSAATFCSTGTPAVFLHPGEAVHGDLGIVTENDVLVVLSNSGETREIIGLLPFMARINVPVIGLTGNAGSSLAARCQVVLDTGVESEADPIAVAPTSSTTVALAMCDALAVALMNRRGFTKEQFAIFHPGGNLGGKLLIKVADLMHVGDAVPKILAQETTLEQAIAVISAKGMGAVFAVAENQEVVGVVTDGDLRRIIESSGKSPHTPAESGNVWQQALSNHMSRNPKSIGAGALAAEALRLMEDNGITVLPVTESGKLVGVIHLHDLIRVGLA